MKLDDKHKTALKKIFGKQNSRNYMLKPDEVLHSQNVVDIIFQTQTYLLGIESNDRQRREYIIDIRIESLVKELRYGKTQRQSNNLLYKVPPIDEKLQGDTIENNEFWNHIETLLRESTHWNFQNDHIIENLKKKIYILFLANPQNSLSYHANLLKVHLCESLQPKEKDNFAEKFLAVEKWAEAVDKENRALQEPGYLIKTVSASLLLTGLCYCFDAISGMSALTYASLEMAGAYLWGQYFRQPLQISYNERLAAMGKLNKEFFETNKLEPVHLDKGDADRVVYTNFHEKLPENAWRDEVEVVEKKNSPSDRDEKQEKKIPRAQQPKVRKFDEIKIKNDQPERIHVWATATTNTKHVTEAWGRYSQKNTFTFFDKKSPDIQKLKKEKLHLYEQFKMVVRTGHVVAPSASEGNKKLNPSLGFYKYEAKLLVGSKGELRVFGREEKSADGATLIVYDKFGPALH